MTYLWSMAQLNGPCVSEKRKVRRSCLWHAMVEKNISLILILTWHISCGTISINLLFPHEMSECYLLTGLYNSNILTFHLRRQSSWFASSKSMYPNRGWKDKIVWTNVFFVYICQAVCALFLFCINLVKEIVCLFVCLSACFPFLQQQKYKNIDYK